MKLSDKVVLYETKQGSHSQPVAFDQMEEIHSPLSRSRIVEEISLQEQPLETDEGDVIVFEHQMLAIEEGPMSAENAILHLLIDGGTRVRG
jgi:hypothetical protein